MLDETTRIGATDPVAAFENAARLASRQLSDACLITEAAENTRRHIFPVIRRSIDAIAPRLGRPRIFSPFKIAGVHF